MVSQLDRNVREKKKICVKLKSRCVSRFQSKVLFPLQSATGSHLHLGLLDRGLGLMTIATDRCLVDGEIGTFVPNGIHFVLLHTVGQARTN